MQLDLPISPVSSKNINLSWTRIFLDDPCKKMAIKVSLLLIATKYFRPQRSVNCRSLNSGCELHQKNSLSIVNRSRQT